MISILVAYDKNRVIGKGGKIPWLIPGERERFKNLTVGHTIVMGRCSYEEIGHPLPNRKTIIVSHSKVFNEQGCITVRSLNEAVAMVDRSEEIFIAGGQAIYKEAFRILDIHTIYATEIEIEIMDGDRFFPTFNELKYDKHLNEFHTGVIPFKYVTYVKKD